MLETKTALDMEIAVYRKLVESEEDRLGIDNTDNSKSSYFLTSIHNLNLYQIRLPTKRFAMLK